MIQRTPKPLNDLFLGTLKMKPVPYKIDARTINVSQVGHRESRLKWRRQNFKDFYDTF